MRTFFIVVLLVLSIDFLLSFFFLKKTKIWENDQWQNKYYRIKSDIYHHDLMPNIDVIEGWGGKLKRKIITNSIGFRDSAQKKINKSSDKKRILLIGDSFIEGSGYDYEFTLAGLLSSKLGNKYEILNSGVESYSPSIYFKKIQHYMSLGYKFDQALIFLDLSDIYDELFIKFDENENIIAETPISEISLERKIKNKIYSLGRILRDNTMTFRFLYLISDRTEIFKNYIKLKVKASKFLNKTFFKTTRDDAMYYRMIHVDRGFWTYNDEKYFEVQKGILQSEKYLKRLFKLFNKNNINSHLIVYPWPAQIQFGDTKHVVYWKKFSESNNINFLSLYDVFNKKNKRETIFDNFIYGDIHWNKNGTIKIFNEIIRKIDF
ncbi:hypothetical protein N9M87_03830 [Candidatus Pelagibacter bacterium]|nr:hypothetical protein [Candidatus Pelagibacter bacterium]